MAFVRYIKLSLMFVCHLDLYFWRLEPPVKDSFVFAEEIVHKDSKRFTGSLGVESLFTYIPVKKTINIYSNLLYNDIDVIEGIGLSLRTFYPWLPRNCILCLTICFLSFYKLKWLEQCPSDFKPVHYRRYGHDIFVLFQSSEHQWS